MKTVFSNNSETVHVWAQRTQLDGRNQNGSLFFEGDSIYSYGYHYLLGEFVTNSSGEVAVIINTGHYSNTTAKHSILAWGTTTHYKQFERKHTEEKSVINLLNELENKLLKARRPLIYIDEANQVVSNHLEYQEFMHGDAEISSKVADAFRPFQLDAEEFKALQDKDKERRKKEAQRQKEKIKLQINDFLNYKINYFQNNNIDAYIRISKCGNFVETSKGVKVPVREAKILYNKILKGEDIKGFKIDHYTVISINGTLKIGCHDINLKNMHEVGKKLLTL